MLHLGGTDQTHPENRRLFCKVNGVSSYLQSFDCGVPQDLCLCPFLFQIYVNDLPVTL